MVLLLVDLAVVVGLMPLPLASPAELTALPEPPLRALIFLIPFPVDTFPGIKICVGYKLGKQTINYFPSSITALEQCQPIYEELPGWQVPTTHITEYDKLPSLAKQYLDRLEELIGCPINLICVGPRREQTILKTPIW